MSTYFITFLTHYMSQYSSVSKVRGYILDLQQGQGISLCQHAGTVLGLILHSVH